MIRDSPHNTRQMHTQIETSDAVGGEELEEESDEDGKIFEDSDSDSDKDV